MSGPIVRRYGFPNFDKIFGDRPLQHGAEEPEQSEAASDQANSSPPLDEPETREHKKEQESSKPKKP
jgi:hypothetical protein